jgi:hypothetical protein
VSGAGMVLSREGMIPCQGKVLTWAFASMASAKALVRSPEARSGGKAIW